MEVSVTNPNTRVSNIGVVAKFEKQVTLILREITQMGLEDSDLANGVIQMGVGESRCHIFALLDHACMSCIFCF